MELIDRDVLKNEMPEMLNPMREGHEKFNQGYNMAISEIYDLINEQPTVTDTNVGCKWIPINEKMPDMHEEVIGCKKFGPGAIDLYAVGSPCWLVDLDSSNPIIAWMPLPEAYKGDEDE